jgi:hypothetical protein
MPGVRWPRTAPNPIGAGAAMLICSNRFKNLLIQFFPPYLSPIAQDAPAEPNRTSLKLGPWLGTGNLSQNAPLWFDKPRLIPVLIGTESGLTMSSDQRSRVSKKSDLSKGERTFHSEFWDGFR